MAKISDINRMNTKDVILKRDEKICVCIVTGEKDKYLLINSKSREKYDDFEIKQSDYTFLSHDSHISCSRTVELKKDRIIKKLGTLNHRDMQKILDKIRKSTLLPSEEKESIILYIEEWLSDYNINKLTNVFKFR